MSGYVYAIRSGDRVKIGWSGKPHSRLSKIRSDSSFECELIGAVPATMEQEREAHSLFSRWRIAGEWFDYRAGPVRAFCDMIPAFPKAPSLKRITQRGPLRGHPIKLIDLAQQLGITTGAISQWRVVPANRVLAVEAATGISRQELRPDLFGPAVPPQTEAA
jgi:hypothetical protein